MGLVRASADVKVFGCCFCLAYVHSAFCLFAGIVRFIVNETDFFFFFLVCVSFIIDDTECFYFTLNNTECFW